MDSVVECLSGVVGLVALAAEGSLSAGQLVEKGLAMPAVALARYGSRSVSKGSISMVRVAAEQFAVSASLEHLAMKVGPMGLVVAAVTGQPGS